MDSGAGPVGGGFEKAAYRGITPDRAKVASFESQLSKIELAVSPVSRACLAGRFAGGRELHTA